MGNYRVGNLANRVPNLFDNANMPKVPHGVQTLTDLRDHIEMEYEIRRKKPTLEESHIRVTFMLDRKIHDKLNKICDTKERGYKTLVLNRAVEAIIREYE